MGKLWDFQIAVDLLRTAQTPAAMDALVGDFARELRFDYITIYNHGDISNVVQSLDHMRSGSLVGISNCPFSWVEQYRDEGLMKLDPRVTVCRSTSCSFSSDDLERMLPVTSDHREFFRHQTAANIGDSFTVPVHFPGEPVGSCLFSMGHGRPLPVKNFAVAHLIGNIAFEAARTMVKDARARRATPEDRPLTERQLQCTILLGRGLSRSAIARRLAISAETVKKHLDDARLAYGVAKSAQLVTKSLQLGEITIYDLFDYKDN